MHTALNEINPETVREESRNETDYLVAPITLIRAMDLDGGYVPEAEVQKSAPAWNGIPLTHGHPTNPSGDFVSANSPEVLDKTSIGRVFANEPDGDAVTGEAWIDVEKAQNLGGKAEEAVERIQAGDPVSVSSAYLYDRFDPGRYDGEHRDTVAGNLRPDHVAVLVNKSGRCSIADGCQVGAPAANMAVTTDDPQGEDNDPHDDDGMSEANAHNVLDRARRPTFGETESTSWGDVSKDMSDVLAARNIDADSVEDMTAGQKDEVAGLTLLGDPEADTWDDLFFFPVVNPSSGSLNENALDAVRGGRGSQADISANALESAQSVAANLLEEHFDRDISSNSLIIRGADAVREFVNRATNGPAESGDCTCNDMSDKRTELIEEHGFNEEGLPEDEEDLERIHEAVTDGGDEEPGDGESEADTSEEQTDDDESSEITIEDLEERFATKDEVMTSEDVSEAVSEALAANQEETEKERLVERVLATNDAYDEDDREELMGTPNPVLENLIGEAPAANADFSARPGAAASTNTDDAENFPSLSARERAKELEGEAD